MASKPPGCGSRALTTRPRPVNVHTCPVFADWRAPRGPSTVPDERLRCSPSSRMPVAQVPRLTSDSTLTPSAIEEVKGAKALGTPVIQPFRRGQPQRECGGGRQIGSDEAMTRQRALKRRIRARMARTGERYSTARRQVLRRLGNGAPPVAEQPEAPEARRPHRGRIGAVALVLAVAVAGAVIVVTQRTEGPTDKGPPTASTSENRHTVSEPDGECRRLSVGEARRLARDLQAVGRNPRAAFECIPLRPPEAVVTSLGPAPARAISAR
jgi:hypothetical protein